CHILPFGFAQQAIGLAGLLTEPGDIGLGILPSDTNNGMSIRLWVIWISPVVTRHPIAVKVFARDFCRIPGWAAQDCAGVAGVIPALENEFAELATGHLEFRNRERMRDRHFVLRTFVRLTTHLGLRRAHH